MTINNSSYKYNLIADIFACKNVLGGVLRFLIVLFI